jgi:hypothetical protein
MAGRILLDTNAYLRLAVLFHPLVMTTVPGEGGGTLYILPDLAYELGNSPRLQNQFAWALEPEMIENRKSCRWRLSPAQRSEIESVERFATRLSQEIANGASPVDIRCLAYGVVLQMPVVTDDGDMIGLAEQIDARTIRTVELLGIMLRTGFCDMDKVRNVVRYWIAVDDLPARYYDTFRSEFGEDPPISAH